MNFSQYLLAIEQNQIIIFTTSLGLNSKLLLEIVFQYLRSGIYKQKIIGVLLPFDQMCKNLQEDLNRQQNGLSVIVQKDFQKHQQKQGKKILIYRFTEIIKLMRARQCIEILYVMIEQRSVEVDIFLSIVNMILKQKCIKIVIVTDRFNSQRLYQQYKNLGTRLKNFIIRSQKSQNNTYYLKHPTHNLIAIAYQTTIQIIKRNSAGNILIFTPSIQDAETLNSMLSIQSQKFKYVTHKIHFNVFIPASKFEKIIYIACDLKLFKSNLTEIKFVIDCGIQRLRWLNESGMQYNGRQVWESKCKAEVRCKLFKNSQCYRLYTQQTYQSLDLITVPQIFRLDISQSIMTLKILGFSNISLIPFLLQPPKLNMALAIEKLHALGLILQNGSLSWKGLLFPGFQLNPNLFTMLINSFEDKYACSKQMLNIVSMLCVSKILYLHENPIKTIKLKKRLGSKQGDLFFYYNLLTEYQRKNIQKRKKMCQDQKLIQNSLIKALSIKQKIKQRIKILDLQFLQKPSHSIPVKLVWTSSSDDPQPIQRAIYSANFLNLAKLNFDGSYTHIKSNEIFHIHPSSILSIIKPKWITFMDIISKDRKYMIQCSQVDQQWIFQLSGHFYKDNRRPEAQKQYQKTIKPKAKICQKKERINLQQQDL